MADDYAWYRAKLRGENPPIHEASPQCGHFKKRKGRNEPFIAVSVWRDGDKLLCRSGDALVDVFDEWTWIAGRPVPEADARFWFEHKRWPDEPDMAVSRVEISDLAKAWKFAKTHPLVLQAITDAAESAYGQTGKLPPGFEINPASEIAA